MNKRILHFYRQSYHPTDKAASYESKMKQVLVLCYYRQSYLPTDKADESKMKQVLVPEKVVLFYILYLAGPAQG